MNKKDIRILLFFWDIIAVILIFFSVFMMFEIVIKKILINTYIDAYYDIVSDIQLEYSNALDFINNKKDLPYSESVFETLKYLKELSLKNLKYENSLVMIISDDPFLEYVIGKNNKKNIETDKNIIDFKKFYLSALKIPEQINSDYYKKIQSQINESEIKIINYYYKFNDNKKKYFLEVLPDLNESELLQRIFLKSDFLKNKKHIEFNFFTDNYIGISELLQVGLHRELNTNNTKKFTPVIIIADLKSDFFYLINKVRNIFLIVLLIIFIVVFIIKMFNTFVITREIKDISFTINNESLAIEKKGEIGTALKDLKLDFKDTSNLYNSYSLLSSKLVNLGEIITGIADKDLFVASLKNDKSILDPHAVNMTVLFLDIKGFTTISEKYKEKSMTIINDIWNTVEKIIFVFNGKVNKYIGDAALIIFPEYFKNNKNMSTLNAIYSGIAILEFVPFLKKKLNIDFNFRIGIDYGRLVYGKTGSKRKYELGVIGDTVNTASRFESLNKQYSTNILLSEKALSNTSYVKEKNYKFVTNSDNKYIFYMMDRARPQGKKESIEIYTILVKKYNTFKFIGSENYFDQSIFEEFSLILSEFIESIKFWQDNQIEEGTKNWITLSKKIARLYNESKFNTCEMFLNKLIKYEELIAYKKDPSEWLKKEQIKIKTPDEDWIKYGTVELSK